MKQPLEASLPAGKDYLNLKGQVDDGKTKSREGRGWPTVTQLVDPQS